MWGFFRESLDYGAAAAKYVDAFFQNIRWEEVAARLARAELQSVGETGMKRITRERPKIDRIACPWLITRFIDQSPEFLYVVRVY